MLPSMTASSSGHWNQDGSRRWQRAMRPVAVEAQPRQHVAAESFGEAEAFAAAGRHRPRPAPVPPAAAARICSIKRHALLDLADADPDPRIDVAGIEHRHLEREPVIGRIADGAARIEGAAGGAAHIAAGAELAASAGVSMPVPTVRSCSEAVSS